MKAPKNITNGPWTAHYDDNGFYYIDAPKRPSPYIAATGSEGAENEDNAFLIAAAPDLLASAKETYDYFMRYATEAKNKGDIDKYDHFFTLATAVKKVLVKAGYTESDEYATDPGNWPNQQRN